MFYSAGIFRTSSLGGSISSNPERTAPRRQGGKPGYIEVLQQRAGSPNVKRLLLIKENQVSQVKEFSIFLCMGRCKSLGSLKSFLWCAPEVSGASILCFHILSFLRAHQLILEGYIANDCDILCLPIWLEIFHFSSCPLVPIEREHNLNTG